MDLSVIVPTWQRHELLVDRCLASLLAEDLDMEIIVVSDGPDPELRQLIGGLIDRRVRYKELPEHPAYPDDPVSRWRCQGVEAINHGLRYATGEWLAVVGDDDAVEPGGYRALIAAAESADAVVYGATWLRRRGGEWLRIGLSKAHGGPDFPAFPFGGAIIRRRAAVPLDPDAWRRGEPADTAMWRAMYRSGAPFRRVDVDVYRYWPSYVG